MVNHNASFELQYLAIFIEKKRSIREQAQRRAATDLFSDKMISKKVKITPRYLWGAVIFSIGFLKLFIVIFIVLVERKYP